MLAAFKDCGFEVTTVIGNGKERLTAIKRILHDIKSGCHFDFCYSEGASIPYALTEANHIPIFWGVDIGFFRMLRQAGIPVGVFYRDAYWLFPFYKKDVSFFKRMLAGFFYRSELSGLNDNVDVLYVPSRSMAERLPGIRLDIVEELPPGGTENDCRSENPQYAGLAAIYVGGVLAPLYCPSEVFVAAIECPRALIYLVCRKEEWMKIADGFVVPENVRILHVGGEELDKIYQCSSVALILNPASDYLSFAMPVKLFEAIGKGLPIIAMRGTAAGSFVEREGLGWVVENGKEAAAILARLFEDPSILSRTAERVRKEKVKHTWQARARFVAEGMSTIRERRA
jgi:glycosyltransferase involved in cell wall biosynthesis